MPRPITGITAEFIVGCIGVLTAGATTMELPITKVLATTMGGGTGIIDQRPLR